MVAREAQRITNKIYDKHEGEDVMKLSIAMIVQDTLGIQEADKDNEQGND